MFDMSKYKWFIAVNGEQEAIAVQEWLVSNGHGWMGDSDKIRTDFDRWDAPYAIGMGHMGGGYLGQANVSYWQTRGHLEIKLDLKLSVDKVKYPVVESQQEKQIKALEATIQLAQEQIQKIKDGM